MTRFLHRPMFRTGGSAGQGITSGLSRQGYNIGLSAKPKDFPGTDAEWQVQQKRLEALGIFRTGGKEPTVSGNTGIKTQSTGSTKPNFEQEMLRKIIGTKIELPRSNTRGNFLTSLGTNILAQPGGQPILQMLGKAAKDPLAQAQSTRSQEGMLKYQHAMSNRDFLLQAWKAMSDDEKTAMMKNIEWLQTEEGGGLSRQEAIDSVAGQFRKQMSPEEKEYKEKLTQEELDRKEISDIQKYYADDYYLDDTDAAKYRDFKDIVDGVEGIDLRRDESVFIDRGSWTNKGGFMGAMDDDGNITLTPDNVSNFEEGYAYIDLKTGQGYYRQGPKLIKIVADEEIISNK